MSTKHVIAAGGLALSLVAGVGVGAGVAHAAAPIGAVAASPSAGKSGVEQVHYYRPPYYGGRPH